MPIKKSALRSESIRKLGNTRMIARCDVIERHLYGNPTDKPRRFRQVFDYTIAGFHRTASPVEDLLANIQERSRRGISKRKVYAMLKNGKTWNRIVDAFAKLTNRTPSQVVGLLYALKSPANWKRTPARKLESHLSRLSESSDFLSEVLGHSSSVNSVIQQIKNEYMFVDQAPQRSGLATSLAILPVVTSSMDSKILLALLSYLSPTAPVTSRFLSRGVTARKRWTSSGEIVNAAPRGIDAKIQDVLADPLRVDQALHDLLRLSLVDKSGMQFSIKDKVARAVYETLNARSPNFSSFLKQQTFVISCWALPWKYLESHNGDIKMILNHIEHTLLLIHDFKDQLGVGVRADLSVTLLESSRFPGMLWKQKAIEYAQTLVYRKKEPFYQYCLVASQRLINRLGRKPDGPGPGQNALCVTNDRKTHAARGFLLIQDCLDQIQIENLSGAKAVVEAWSPLDSVPSAMEAAVLFRKNMMLGRIARFEGQFLAARGFLRVAQDLKAEYKDLFFEEDLCGLTCDLADTSRELGDPVSAAELLHSEIKRRQEKKILSGMNSLKLCLAEAMFAQQCYTEASKCCLDVATQQSLSRPDKLRLHIITAKVRYMEGSHEKANDEMIKAFQEASKFPLINGRFTQQMLKCVKYMFPRSDGYCGHEDATHRIIEGLRKSESPGGTSHWIAGMTDWLDYLEKTSSLADNGFG